MRREGTFLLRQRGTVLKLPGGERAIVFHPDKTGNSERPMVLVPCQELQRMEQVMADRGEPVAFSVSGEVLAYRGVNYLLPTVYTLVQPGAAADEPQRGPPAPKEKPSPQGPAPAREDPSVQDLIKHLEAQRERPQTIEPGIPAPTRPANRPDAGAPASSTQASASRVIPEGRTVVRRRARMVRAPGGEWSLSFDTGPKGDPDLDRPMRLVPCMNLQRMESWAASRGDAVSLEVSGQVLAYQGGNYLLPTLYRVYPEAELAPRQ